MLAIFYFILLFIVFYALWILCDEFLVPTVEVFIKQFDVPEEVAGRLLFVMRDSLLH